MTHATIIGARGYLGRQVMRALLRHPDIDRITPVSSGAAGTPYAEAVPSFRGTGLRFAAIGSSEALDADVAFFATPAGEAEGLAEQHLDAGAKTVIDLSRDHRLAAIQGDDWTYGMPEVLPVPKGARRIANPGCYPTAATLAMAPALKTGAIEGPLIVDGKSGVSGAGITPRPALHFPAMNESVRAYKVVGHDHTAEIAAVGGRIAGTPQKVRFTPHLVPQTRGLLTTCYMHVAPGSDPEAIRDAYRQYDGSPVHFVSEADTGHVVHGHGAQVAIDHDPETDILTARCAIDNMARGGATTAIENMNHALGRPAHEGLTTLGGNL